MAEPGSRKRKPILPKQEVNPNGIILKDDMKSVVPDCEGHAPTDSPSVATREEALITSV